MKSKKRYYKSGMLFFYKNNLDRIITTLVYDTNDVIWKIKGPNAFVPAWKVIYIFTINDYKLNKMKIIHLMNSSAFGKILKCEIQGRKVYMLVLYKIGTEKLVSKKCKYFKLENTYQDFTLGFSKRIYANCYVSQGEGYHREECDEKELTKYFCGDNFYKYNFRRRSVND